MGRSRAASSRIREAHPMPDPSHPAPLSASLEERATLITGASGGIGSAIARSFGAAGARLMLVARKPAPLKRLASELREAGAEAEWRRTDVTDAEQVSEAVRAAHERWGRLDILVTCAGIGRFAAVGKLSLDDWDATIAVNLRGAFLCCKAAAEVMRRNGGGVILNVASIGGVQGFPKGAAYCASKFGVVGLSESLAQDLLPHNIRVYALCPSSVDTPFHDAAPKHMPREKMLRPADIADLALFLASRPDRVVYERVVVRPRA